MRNIDINKRLISHISLACPIHQNKSDQDCPTYLQMFSRTFLLKPFTSLSKPSDTMPSDLLVATLRLGSRAYGPAEAVERIAARKDQRPASMAGGTQSFSI